MKFEAGTMDSWKALNTLEILRKFRFFEIKVCAISKFRIFKMDAAILSVLCGGFNVKRLTRQFRKWYILKITLIN